jgi:hypothetical protein
MLLLNKREKKRVGRIRIKKDKLLSASHIAWHCIVLTLPGYKGKGAFKFSDIQ